MTVRVCVRRCWSCVFDQCDSCNGDATDSEDVDLWEHRRRVADWLRSLGPVPVEFPVSPVEFFPGRRGTTIVARRERIVFTTPFGPVDFWDAPNDPGRRPSYPCGCWCRSETEREP